LQNNYTLAPAQYLRIVVGTLPLLLSSTAVNNRHKLRQRNQLHATGPTMLYLRLLELIFGFHRPGPLPRSEKLAGTSPRRGNVHSSSWRSIYGAFSM